MTKKLGFHPAANIYSLNKRRIGRLAKDIRQNGLQDPIARLGGKILDGRLRWLACQHAKVKPRFCDVAPADPVAYVLSQAAHRRRRPTVNAAAMCGARAYVLSKQAEEQRRNRKGTTAKKGLSRSQIGSILRVSTTTIGLAGQVLRDGIPELVCAVEAGKVSLADAVVIARRPRGLQEQHLDETVKRRRRGRPRLGKVPPLPPPPPPEKADVPPGVPRGVGINRGNDAINALSRIPRNDRLRERGFQIVVDWIKHNR